MTEKHDSIADGQVTDFQSEFRLSDEAQDGVLFWNGLALWSHDVTSDQFMWVQDGPADLKPKLSSSNKTWSC